MTPEEADARLDELITKEIDALSISNTPEEIANYFWPSVQYHLKMFMFYGELWRRAQDKVKK